MNLLIDVAVRPSILLLFGLGLAVLLRHRAAACRHCVVAVTIFAAAATVPLSRALPSWTVTAIEALPDALPSTTSVERAEPVPPAAREPEPGRQAGMTLAVVWAAGFVASAALLAMRIVLLIRVSRRAVRVTDDRVTAIVRSVSAAYRLRRPVIVLESDAPGLIATWGVLRPMVLLPAEARTWSSDRTQTVLCHELAHVRRYDWIVQMTAELVRAVYWFNPLMVVACRRLRRESEQACDDQVLGAGIKASDYASHLLALANASRPERSWVSAMPMARASTLERRIAVMLQAGLDRRALSLRTLIVTIVLLLGVALPIAALRAAQSSPLPLTGVIYDPSGGVLPGVSVTLVDAQDVKWQATTDASGRFEFLPVQPGRYILEAQLAGFRSLRNDLDLKTARDWNRAITLSVGDIQEQIVVSASRSTASQPQGPRPIRVGGNIKAPTKLVHVSPTYPASMREAGLSGVVPIEAIIGADGSVLWARVRGAHVHPDFAAAAIEAVRQWVFSPTLLNGRPVEVVMNVSIKFELSD